MINSSTLNLIGALASALLSRSFVNSSLDCSAETTIPSPQYFIISELDLAAIWALKWVEATKSEPGFWTAKLAWLSCGKKDAVVIPFYKSLEHAIPDPGRSKLFAPANWKSTVR